jgi:hypothetical protein
MIEAIVAILAGLLLLSEAIRGPIIRNLQPFQTVIGVIALVAGILNFLSLFGIVLILAGLILAINALAGVPAIGDGLTRAGRALNPFRLIIGIVVLILGIAALI